MKRYLLIFLFLMLFTISCIKYDMHISFEYKNKIEIVHIIEVDKELFSAEQLNIPIDEKETEVIETDSSIIFKKKEIVNADNFERKGVIIRDLNNGYTLNLKLAEFMKTKDDDKNEFTPSVITLKINKGRISSHNADSIKGNILFYNDRTLNDELIVKAVFFDIKRFFIVFAIIVFLIALTYFIYRVEKRNEAK